ncbi:MULTISPECIES: molybdopterin-guanine dinucleotide biosynthesis protein B [Nitrospirillum]|uniref:Molybdopterin guanine dinucleotide biosynthesis accessory protein MobB n=1 Tax=Nitrospirillum amazonense TaxID=28077 RepID=A0A560G119_9PROT|nr:molybdopterin-guanine dinucleotide biosynthesis protein B [Nitrospirillum amazonense]MEC4589601.1 molybdopterin-guanine dinucleotide biosynthesis protein B [Nitrospirillum amazonense]TWB27585.1 molybdopterin guanine dinucleotide biosynthesis accessory protein MobB [Nitrospirillum amazonense]
MKLFGLAGWSGSGKTTLMVRLIPELTGRGYGVSTLKHAHHDFDVDQPGKDSHRHRTAGATEVLVASSRRWALMHELRGAAEPTLADLVAKLSPVDLVLVEGFKRDPIPKLEIWRVENGKAPLFPDDPTIVALAADGPLPVEVPAGLPRFPLDAVADIATFILAHVGLSHVGLPPRAD